VRNAPALDDRGRMNRLLLTDLRGILATISLAVALPLLRLDMIPLLFFI
jgi:hypothetical protein